MIKDLNSRINEILSESEEVEDFVKLVKEADDAEQQDDNQDTEQDTEPDNSDNENTDDNDSSKDDNNTENDDNDETKDDEKEPEEEFKADSFEDLLEKTETKVDVKKEGSEPSPIFGPNDLNKHNKYRITLSNKNGKISFIYWDSIANTKANKKYDVNDAIACFGLDCSAYGDGVSFEDFKSEFGYDETDDDQAQKAYEGCRKNMEKAKKLFDEGQLKELMRLASEH